MRKQEAVRKLLHIPGGFAPPLAVLLFGWSGAVALNVFLLAYLLVGWDLGRRGVKLPLLWALVQSTQRAHEQEPVSAAEFLAATLLCGLLFPLPYFFAAVALLGVGDGLASVAGQLWGRHKLPWNRRKSWQGFAVGAVAGTAAYVAFAIVGGQMQSRGFAEGAALLGTGGSWPVLVFLLVAFPVVHVGASLIASLFGLRRHANARFTDVLKAFGVALAPTLAVLLVMPYWLGGPALPTLGGHGPLTMGLLVAVPGAVMAVESTLTRHDNAWIPILACVLAYAVVAATGPA